MAKFTEITAQQIRGTLARSLVPLADNLRDLLSQFGLRVYKVSVIRVRWSGGERGVGVPEVVSVKILQPTPKISTLESIDEIIQPIGQHEEGGIKLSKISGTYTEEDLLGQSKRGEEIPEDQEVFYEVEYPRVDGGPSEKRRFYPKSVPTYYPGKLSWEVRLERQHKDRDRDGEAHG